MAQEKLIFPTDFKWGVATSSYQIEGAVNEDGRSPSIWDTFTAQAGKISDGTNGDVAVEHYRRYRDDVAMMKRLGVKAYRFSIAWPRILPEGVGRINELGLDFYQRLIDELLENDIEPYATLYHWDMPQAQHDRAGWHERGIVDAFVEYVDVVTRAFSDRVQNWMTINEPWVVAWLGYGSGEHAPGIRDSKAYLAAAHHVLLAHGRAVPVIRANGDANTKVGIVLNLSWADGVTDKPEDQAAAQRWMSFFNRWYLDPLYKGEYPADIAALYGIDNVPIQAGDMEIIQAPTDFLGVNYYSRSMVGAAPQDDFLSLTHHQTDNEYTAMGWEVYPQGLYHLLTELHTEYSIPAFYITENGAAYSDVVAPDGEVHDERRVNYLHGHFAAAHRAIQEGVPLRGYFVWSLMDNFEWSFGYSRRFGIVYVDYETQTRILKDSAKWYTDVIRENGLLPVGVV